MATCEERKAYVCSQASVDHCWQPVCEYCGIQINLQRRAVGRKENEELKKLERLFGTPRRHPNSLMFELPQLYHPEEGTVFWGALYLGVLI